MLRDQLKGALNEALKAKDALRVSTIRLILAAIKDRDIAARTQDASEQDDDASILGLLAKMVKQRNESAKVYAEAGRQELADRELREIEIIEDFMPRQMSDGEIAAACEALVKELGAEGLKDMGRVMGELKSRYSGQMDFSKASAAVKKLLAA